MTDERNVEKAAVRSQALAIQRSLTGGSGEPVRSFKPMRGLAIAYQLLEFGALEQVQQFLNEHVTGDSRPLQRLRLYLEKMPPISTRQTEFLDDPESDLQIVPVQDDNRRPVLFVFCGHAQRFSMPLNIMHRWFAMLDAHIVYLKDIRRAFYLSGIASLGTEYAQTIERLTNIAVKLNASGIRCTGNSGGTFGALSMGIDLGAERVLCMSGPTRLDMSLDTAFDQLSHAGIRLKDTEPQNFDLRRKLRDHPSKIDVRSIFGALNVQDRSEAENLSGLHNVELVPVENWERHGVTDGLIRTNTLSDHLSWVTSVT